MARRKRTSRKRAAKGKMRAWAYGPQEVADAIKSGEIHLAFDNDDAFYQAVDKRPERMWELQFGAGMASPQRVLVFGGNMDSALEEAAAKLKDQGLVGYFTSQEEIEESDHYDPDTGEARDHIYTESGYIESWNFWMGEVDTGGPIWAGAMMYAIETLERSLPPEGMVIPNWWGEEESNADGVNEFAHDEAEVAEIERRNGLPRGFFVKELGIPKNKTSGRKMSARTGGNMRRTRAPRGRFSADADIPFIVGVANDGQPKFWSGRFRGNAQPFPADDFKGKFFRGMADIIAGKKTKNATFTAKQIGMPVTQIKTIALEQGEQRIKQAAKAEGITNTKAGQEKLVQLLIATGAAKTPKAIADRVSKFYASAYNKQIKATRQKELELEAKNILRPPVDDETKLAGKAMGKFIKLTQAEQQAVVAIADEIAQKAREWILSDPNSFAKIVNP